MWPLPASPGSPISGISNGDDPARVTNRLSLVTATAVFNA
jgi:hypothetical protein